MGLGAFIALMGGGGLWGWLASHSRNRLDLITLAQTIAEATITALDKRIAQMEATIEDQGLKIEELTVHIGKLEDVIVGLGGIPPQRPRRKPQA